MIRREKIRKFLAIFFLCLLWNDILLPIKAWALTTGPAQPEAKQFAEAGTADMVDLFTGDFKYNIPLLDVDGYPVNLSYQGGTGMDDEASWAGLGWNVNVGAINRQLRGVPDDMSGDEVETEFYVKPKITVGGRATVRFELTGMDMAKVSGSLSLGIFSDNYTGIGAEVGGNAGLTLGLSSGGTGTSGLGLSAGLGLNSSTATGVDLQPNISLAWTQQMTDVNAGTAAISMNLGYNTRQGLKDLSLGASFNLQNQRNGYNLATHFNYNTPAIYPRIQTPYRSVGRTFSGDFGPAYLAAFTSFGFTGYKNVREVLRPVNSNPSFGFMYAERGKKIRPAVMDFLREKDNVIIPALPNLPVPIHTPDMFSYTGQAGSGQFRLYRGTSGIYFDAEAKDESDNQTLGADVGLGSYIHGGVSFYQQNISTVTGKWEKENNYGAKGDFEDPGSLPNLEEGAYFKQVGEKNAEDPGFTAAVKGERPVWVDVNGKTATSSYAYLDDALVRQSEPIPYASVKKTGRQKRREPVSYLTAQEASKAGLDRTIKDYGLNDVNSFTPAACSPTATSQSRVSQARKAHHLSELSVTGNDGKRMVYGLPVYNLEQEECSFTVDPARVVADATDISSRNLVTIQRGGKETDQYYKREKQPGYASAFLLTAVLSPDYVDVKRDGVTDDDRGTAIKFNYGKLPGVYQWRSPYDENKAFYNKGLYADKNDDKGSFVYGKKEIWYLHSIETKTKIAYFLMEDRQDALGVKGVMGGKETGVKQKRLAEIRLYSKSDLTKPIKTVVLRHGYSLCDGVPNTVSGGGKLTLDTLYFTYGNSQKGKHHPYIFDYNKSQGYAYLASDRWGTFKPATANATDGFDVLHNDEFPYTTRNKTAAEANAGMWLLNKITLPGGGEMQVEYESDDYAFVQNKRAMEMVKVEGLYKGAIPDQIANLRDAEWIRLKLSKKPSTTNNLIGWFRRNYLDGGKQLYVKMFVNVTDAPAQSGADHFDFVSAYAEVADAYMASATDDYIYIKMRPGEEGNPLVVAAWQKMKLEYPMYAYPGYKNRVQDNRPVEAVLSAVINSFRTLNELKENFYERAHRKGYASTVNFDKSFARVVKTDGKRLGGGSRVKKLKISDKWAAMTGTAMNETAVYGQEYSYTTMRNGEEISSGVASYEPSIGGDENPMHQPISYTEDLKGALNNYFYLEEPFGESLFPAPLVGYSQVVVRDLDESGNADPEKMTGYSQHEFYTARDYPVITRHSSIETYNRHPNGFSSFVGGHELHELAMTQGYTIVLNDMHGKPKADRVYNKSGAEISSTVYYYADENLDAGTKRLTNLAYTVNEKGEVSSEKTVIGREMELFTDMREEEMINSGKSVHIGVDIIPFIWFPLPIPHWPTRNNDEYRLFRSASVIKVAQYYGILEKVVKTENGSTITSSNLVYDHLTGDPVLSSTTNEFDDPVYNLQLPAYWVYPYMGGTYQNVNAVLKGFTTGTNGVINTAMRPYISPGDQLVNITDGGDDTRYWVVYSQTGTSGTKEYRLVNDAGSVMPNFKKDMKIVRSGYRNILQASASSIVSLDNPVRNNYLRLENGAMNWLRVLDAKAAEFDEEWSAPDECVTCPTSAVRQADGTCTYKAIENPTDSCMIFCVGNDDDVYSVDGALLYNTSGTPTAERLQSPFWGGPAQNCGFVPSGMLSSFRQARDSTPTSSVMKTFNTSSLSYPAVCNRTDYTMSTIYCGRMPASRIWLCTNLIEDDQHARPLNVRVGFRTCVDIPEPGAYYVGMGGDNAVKVVLSSGSTIYFNRERTEDPNGLAFQTWHLYPVTLPAGRLTIEVSGENSGWAAAFGAEIYKAGYPAIKTVQEEDIIFSTKQIPGANVQTFRETGRNTNQYIYRYTGCANGATLDECGIPNCGPVPLNPYVAGYLGNWRLWKENAFIVSRTDNGLLNTGTKGARLRNSGHYQLVPWWYYNTAMQKWTRAAEPAATLGKWVTGRSILLYNNAGTELENVDALGRASSAAYGFADLLPTAVAANARNREIFYDGFEDYNFRNRCGTEQPCDKFFDIKRALGTNYAGVMNSAEAHSGNYSLHVSGGITLHATAHTLVHKSSPGTGTEYTLNTSRGEYVKRNIKGLYNNGFAPVPGKKYIFSAWVKDGQPASTSPGISLEVNDIQVDLERKAVVESWKLVEGVVDLAALNVTGDHTWTISGGASVLIDDIRIFPYDAHIKSYAYDEKTLRLMAEMDENNFSTFYEYDEEGSLIRIKKETERGIMTLKESRSALRKQ